MQQYILEVIMDKIEKVFKFKVKKFSEDEDSKSHIGTVEGHISTFGNVDRDGDVFARTAFDRTLQELKSSGKVFLPMLWQHRIDKPIGGFPLEVMSVDDKGLFVRGEVNLNTNGGRDAFALLKQGVISEFSIGFIPVDRKFENGTQIFEDVDLIEASLVTIPANPMATVTNVKAVVPFQDIPIVRHNGEPDTSFKWDASSAADRVRQLTVSNDHPSANYKNAFLEIDCEDADSFGAYKLPIADVVDGKLAVIPRAIFAAAAIVQITRDGVDIADNEKAAIIGNIERYYSKMGFESPFKKGFGIREIKSSPVKVIKKMLQVGTNFTKAGADFIAGLEAGRRKSAVRKDRDSSGIHKFESKMKEFKELNHVRNRHQRTQRTDGGSGHHAA